MTVQGAIAWLNLTKLPLHGETSMGNEVINMAIQSIEEVEQYRALGTVEELKEAREKQIPKKPIEKKVLIMDEQEIVNVCPVCESEIGLLNGQPYCECCGQKLDWEEGGTSD